MTELLEDQDCLVTEYSDVLTRQLVENITVNDGNFKVEFKVWGGSVNITVDFGS